MQDTRPRRDRERCRTAAAGTTDAQPWAAGSVAYHRAIGSWNDVKQ
jgi:hypothetical protein